MAVHSESICSRSFSLFKFLLLEFRYVSNAVAIAICYHLYSHMQLIVLPLPQSPQMGRRAAPESVVEPELTSDDTNGDVPGEPRAPLTSAQRLAVSTSAAETAADPFAHDAKFFTEMRVLNREVSNVFL